MRKIVSVSVWGTDPRYIEGARKNAALVAKHYPGWEYRVYAAPESSKLLSGLAADIRPPVVEWNNGRFWRFQPAFESDVEVMISRDCDSRVSAREAACVLDWLEGTHLCNFHTIRDHERHYDFPFLAGMWGVRGGIFEYMRKTITPYAADPNAYLVDQIWLAQQLVPYIKSTGNDIVVDGIKEPNSWLKKNDPGQHFIGQGYDENDKPLY